MRQRRNGLIEEFSLFDKARLNNGATDLDERLANAMLAEVERRLGSGRSAEDEMEFVLNLNEVWNRDHRHAYKSFFGRTWNQRRTKRNKERDEAFKREFAPLSEDGHH